MGKSISFALPIVPPSTTHQSKRIVTVAGHGKLADTPELRETKRLLEGLLLEHRPEAPLEGPVALTLEFVWPWLKGHSKRRRSSGIMAKITKPDCSNLAKTLEDALVRTGFLVDDNQVYQLFVSKHHGDQPGIWVNMECLWSLE